MSVENIEALKLALVQTMISQQRVHPLGNFVRIGHAIDRLKETLVPVIWHEGYRLCLISRETSPDRFGIVVGTPRELLAATPIAGVCRGRSIEVVMVACTATGT